MTRFDASALRAEFLAARQLAQQRALWEMGDPGRSLDDCRYCGKRRQRFAGSRLDGHASCLVDEDFKSRLGELLRLPTVTYAEVAGVLG